MASWIKHTALALAVTGAIAATPASATIFEYTMDDGDVLTIDTVNGTGSWVGDDINTSFTGDFSNFQGGASPSFSFTLSSLTGTRDINGRSAAPTNRRGNLTHPFMLLTQGNDNVNLWSWWGNPVTGGDYVRRIAHYSATPPTHVPAPGVLGLLAMALIALGFGRRRRRSSVV